MAAMLTSRKSNPYSQSKVYHDTFSRLEACLYLYMVLAVFMECSFQCHDVGICYKVILFGDHRTCVCTDHYYEYEVLMIVVHIIVMLEQPYLG
jgi:hypothetical protein